jgi:hypothetical protein
MNRWCDYSDFLQARGTVFERLQMTPHARDFLDKAGLSKRASVVGGDFFAGSFQCNVITVDLSKVLNVLKSLSVRSATVNLAQCFELARIL